MGNHAAERKNVVSEWQQRQKHCENSYYEQLETSGLILVINRMTPTYHSHSGSQGRELEVMN
jgi:hypothetical protein